MPTHKRSPSLLLLLLLLLLLFIIYHFLGEGEELNYNHSRQLKLTVKE